MIKAITLVTVLAIAGCGAIFNDHWQTVNVSAPPDVSVTLDGMPTGKGAVLVDARRPHTFEAFRDGKPIGTCIVDNEIQMRYLVADLVLFASIVPLALDAITGDWYSPDKTFCSFQ